MYNTCISFPPHSHPLALHLSPSLSSSLSLSSDKKAAETELVSVQNDRDTLSARTAALEGEVKRLRRELEDEKEITTQLKEAEVGYYDNIRTLHAQWI